MQLSKGLVTAALVVISSNSLAGECLVSTTPRALFANVENLAKEDFHPEKGEYSAELKDGSHVTARFDLCGLGLTLNYLVKHKGDDLPDYIKLLLVSAVPSENTASAVASQVVKYTEEDFRNGVTLQGINGDHWIQVKDSPDPLYTAAIHYQWLPPEH